MRSSRCWTDGLILGWLCWVLSFYLLLSNAFLFFYFTLCL